MGLQGLERGAAAQGSLLSGGTQKALARYSSDYASNEYGNAYNRAYQKLSDEFQCAIRHAMEQKRGCVESWPERRTIHEDEYACLAVR